MGQKLAQDPLTLSDNKLGYSLVYNPYDSLNAP